MHSNMNMGLLKEKKNQVFSLISLHENHMTAWNIIQVVVCFHNCDPFYVKFLPLILLNVSRSNDLMFLSQYRFPDPSALAFLLVVSFVDVDN